MANQRGKDILIIFVKHPEPGKVKTRLAATVGHDMALKVYRSLLQRTFEITQPLLEVKKEVHYGDQPVSGDLWDIAGFDRYAQTGEDLGARMAHAFQKAFDQGADRAVIIGSDCYELDTQRLQEAFQALERHDSVIGPSTDGGYYLLGMAKPIPEFFDNKEWSTASVAGDTMADAERLGLSMAILPSLTDIDTEKDLITIPKERRVELGIIL